MVTIKSGGMSHYHPSFHPLLNVYNAAWKLSKTIPKYILGLIGVSKKITKSEIN